MKNLIINNRKLIGFVIFYSLLLCGFAFGVYKFAEGIESYTLPAGSIELNSEYSSYVVGEPVKVSIKNNLNTTIYIKNECPNEPLNVYRWENEKWTAITEKTSASSCTNKQREIGIKPNSTQIVSYEPWNKLFAVPGKYRVLAAVGGFRSFPYIDFVVIAPVEPKPIPVPSSVPSQQNAPANNGSTNQTPVPTPAPTPPTTTPNNNTRIEREPENEENDD